MYDKEELCKKIIDLYPEIDQGGIDLDVFYSTAKKTWVVELKSGAHKLQHHLPKHDARDCMEGKQCLSLKLEIAQLMKNIQQKQF